MKQKYVIPVTEAIYTELRDGLLDVTISGGGAIEDDDIDV